MDTVGQWVATRTFHHARFAGIEELWQCKEAQGLTLSLCIPTLDEAATIGEVIACLRSALCGRVPLLDEIAVIDSGSRDRTLEQAAAAGAEVYRAADILPATGHHRGKGENLWKALHQLRGDILVFIDADITNIHPRFVTGLLGPLLHHPEIGYVKACYDRPDRRPETETFLGGGRVTEILVRPMLSRHFPELTGFVQPLAGEYAARRSLLETIPFPVGYGVEVAHLVDLHARHGLGIFAQTDLGQRCHRSRSNAELGRTAGAILQVLERRLQRQGGWPEPAAAGLLHQFARRHGAFRRETLVIDEPERPPMREVEAYRQQRQAMGAGHGAWSLPPTAVADHLVATPEP